MQNKDGARTEKGEDGASNHIQRVDSSCPVLHAACSIAHPLTQRRALTSQAQGASQFV